MGRGRVVNVIRVTLKQHDEIALTIVARMWFHIVAFVLPGFLLPVYGSTEAKGARPGPSLWSEKHVKRRPSAR